jgi:hypothetical protein
MSIYYAGAAIKKKAFSYSTASTVAALPCSSNIPPPLFYGNPILCFTLLCYPNGLSTIIISELLAASWIYRVYPYFLAVYFFVGHE